MTKMPIEQMLALGHQVLRETKSIVRLLGPYRAWHPAWDAIQKEARNRLSPSERRLAERMDRALDRYERAQFSTAIIKHEREQLVAGRVTIEAEHELPVLKELLHLGLAEFVELDEPRTSDDGKEYRKSLKLHAPLVECARAMAPLAERASVRFGRARAVVVKRESAARRFIGRAEDAVAGSKLLARRKPLQRLLDDFERHVDLHRLVLPNLVEPPDWIPDAWKAHSVSLSMLSAARDLPSRSATGSPPDDTCVTSAGAPERRPLARSTHGSPKTPSSADASSSRASSANGRSRNSSYLYSRWQFQSAKPSGVSSDGPTFAP